MAVVQIPEPMNSNPQTVDWMFMLNKLGTISSGFYLMDFNTTSVPPVVKTGSRFEVNGSFFVVQWDEPIIGYNDIPNNQIRFIYAIPSQPSIGQPQTCTFEYSTTAPSFIPALGGSYNGNNRCIGRLRKYTYDSCDIQAYDNVYSRDIMLPNYWMMQVPTPPMP